MKKSFTVHDLPKTERPRERLKKFGAEALSAQELLAIIIGRGSPKQSVMKIAQELLTTFGSIKAISNATIEQLDAVTGIGPAKAMQIKACFELAKRKNLEPENNQDAYIETPKDVVNIISKELADKTKEHFKIIMLNTRNKVIGVSGISIGTLNASLVHPREVFKAAIDHCSASIILVHNHPSGDPEPSDDDLIMTKRLVDSGKLVGIEVIDHIIIGKNGYYSFKDKKLL
ncbi:MAG: DNA repair protein RadC [candidate division WOR-3 bacterium]